MRFETEPGELRDEYGQLQVRIAEQPETVHLFVFTLGYSRRLFLAIIATHAGPRRSMATSARSVPFRRGQANLFARQAARLGAEPPREQSAAAGVTPFRWTVLGRKEERGPQMPRTRPPYAPGYLHAHEPACSPRARADALQTHAGDGLLGASPTVSILCEVE